MDTKAWLRLPAAFLRQVITIAAVAGLSAAPAFAQNGDAEEPPPCGCTVKDYFYDPYYGKLACYEVSPYKRSKGWKLTNGSPANWYYVTSDTTRTWEIEVGTKDGVKVKLAHSDKYSTLFRCTNVTPAIGGAGSCPRDQQGHCEPLSGCTLSMEFDIEVVGALASSEWIQLRKGTDKYDMSGGYADARTLHMRLEDQGACGQTMRLSLILDSDAWWISDVIIELNRSCRPCPDLEPN